MKFRWSLAPPNPLLAGQLAKALGISPLLAQCLLNRGLNEHAAINRFQCLIALSVKEPIRAIGDRPALIRQQSEFRELDRVSPAGCSDV